MSRDGDILCPLSRLTDEDPPRVCARMGAHSFSYQEMDGLAGGVQDWLNAQGLQAGERLAVSLPPDPRWIALVIGCLRESIVLTPLNMRIPLAEREAQCEQVQAALHLTHFPEWIPHQRPKPVLPKKARATIVFSSGSTGRSKAIVHRLGQHLASAEASIERDVLLGGDTWLLSLPLYHVGGLAILFRCLFAGACVHLPSAEESGEDLLLRSGLTHASLVPTQLHRLLSRSPTRPAQSTVKRILIGGAAAGSELLQKATEGGWPVATCYGSTETGSQVASVPAHSSHEDLHLSSGICLSHAKAVVSDSGELLVHAESLAEGLWEDQEVRPLTDDRGWYPTGDAARIGEGGWIFITGRMDRMMISGGENIHPEIIEKALRDISQRGQVVVVPVEDAEFGHRPGAWVEGDVTADLVEGWKSQLRKVLPGYMIPVGFKSLPPTSGLKPRLDDLKRQWVTHP